MKTADDKFYCVTACCDNNFTYARSLYSMYLFQMAGFNLGYRFKITTSGVCSRDFDAYMNDKIADGSFKTENGNILTCFNIEEYLLNTPIDLSGIEITDFIISSLANVTDDELALICLTDILIQDTLKKGGAEYLQKQRETIESTLATLSSSYTKENFDVAINITRALRKIED